MRREPLPPAEPVPSAEVIPTTPAIDLPRIPFKDVTASSGITFAHENGAAGEKLLPETMGGGVGVFDYDGDEDMDLLFANSSRWPWNPPSDEPAATCALYANDGKGNFKNVSKEAGLDISLYGMGCAVGDYDNDGDPDLYLTAVGANRLLRNDSGRFVDVTDQAGVAGPADAWGTSCGWLDFDNDGRLDLWVCNYVVWSRELDRAQNFRFRDGRPAYGRPQNFAGVPPTLYRNRGDGSFEDVSESAGLRAAPPVTGEPLPKSLGVTFADFDEDGDLDAVVANDTVQNMLFENVSVEGAPRFREIGAAAGIAFDANGEARGAMGVDSARFRDGNSFGVAIGNFSNEMTALYVTPAGRMEFTDEAVANGLGPRSRSELKFGTLFTDFDLDGRPDVFSANGHLEDEIESVQPTQRYEQPPHLFWNSGSTGPAEFHPLTEAQLGPDFLNPIAGRGAAYADFDADGDLDLVITASGGPPRLLRNDLPNDRRWLRLRLIGSKSNRDAIGATVRVTSADAVQVKSVMPTRSYLSQVEPILTFGFGPTDLSKPIDHIEIKWPSGRTATLSHVTPGKLHTILEP